jgi:hypothetical protein
MVVRLIEPLILDIFERSGGVYREADEDHMGFSVGKWSEAFIVFLAGGVPESELNMFAIDAAVGNVIFKDSGNL